MKLQQYINEMVSIKKWEELRDIIDKECQPFIKELKGCNTLLYRGVQNMPSFYDKKIPRTDRKPRLIQPDLHKKLGDLSKKKFGWNIREEGIFTTNNKSYTKQWGKPSIVFPIGNFEYVYNNNVEDLYGLYDQWYTTSDINDIKADKFFKSYIIPEINKYNTNDIKSYLKKPSKNQSECIIKCKSYFSINAEWDKTLIAWFGERKYKV